MNNTGYVAGSTGSSTATGTPADGPDHSALKKQYLSYLDSKSEEIQEQQDSRRYYHGAQWTDKQIKAFNRRKQPVVTYNRIARKINAVVGLLERQRQDPRGFPRTPSHEEGAEVATAVLRYCLDEQDWTGKSAKVGLDGAVDGLGGVEIIIEQGDMGDAEIGFEDVDPSSFFYDPRSLKMDFSDARYMGVGKWADVEATVEMFPELEQDIRASVEAGTELTSNPDSDNKWYSGGENNRRIRIVDHWYIKNGKWMWCIYTGALILASGESYLTDEKRKTICKFIMYSCNVDQDGDRYGFVRNMKSSQDEINQRRSKGLHILNSRRMIVSGEHTKDVEKWRAEAARPDGVIVYPPQTTPPIFDDSAKAQELNGHLGYLEDAKSEIENYGFNPALIGSGVQAMSGRAINLQQQAGIAELGPFLISHKGWKLRVYRAIWCAVQNHWTSERWIRVTDDENVAQFFAVNQAEVDPMTFEQRLVNGLGALDVDIIIDEGPDTVNMQADAYDTLTVMATRGQAVPPELLIELSPLVGSVKKKVQGILEKAQQRQIEANQPGPAQMAAVQLDLQEKAVKNAETEAKTDKLIAETNKTIAETGKTITDARVSAFNATKPDPARAPQPF